MQSIQVIRFCTYPGKEFPQDHLSDELLAAKLLILAVKAAPILKSGLVPCARGKGLWLLNENTRGKAFEWFAQMAAGEVGGGPGVALVPIPGAWCTSAEEVKRGGTFRLAEALGEECGVRVCPALYWDEPLRRARDGGPRSAEQLFIHLRLEELPSEIHEVVLVDDMYTKGGHIRACEAALRIHHNVRVEKALCVGRTVEKPLWPVFGRRVIRVGRFLDLANAVGSAETGPQGAQQGGAP